MVFSSLSFLFVFLPIVLSVYYLLPEKYRNIFLFFSDLIFYAWGEPVLVILMLTSILLNWVFGLLIEKNNSKKKALLITSLSFNILLLGYFKYAALAVETVNYLPFINLQIPKTPLPIGISFYTFQIMSYLIDIYRNDTKAQKNPVNFGTYVSLFPQLIAGPIVRYRDIDNQLTERKENTVQFEKGIELFLLGLFKKVIIANPMGLLWDEMREIPQAGAVAAWTGVVAYSLQIYFDFSGYSDMARGLGKMFGFELTENFNYPYVSKSITEFWRRWHISLGTWFREYVYYPLGGNRKGKPRTFINILIVWLLTGLWHGASINFILWGLYFGAILILEKSFILKALNHLPDFIAHIYALILIAFGWVIFWFSKDVGGFDAFKQFIPLLFKTGEYYNAYKVILGYLPSLIFACIACTPVFRKFYCKFSEKSAGKIIRIIAVLVALTICTSSIISDSYNPFLYFKF